MLTHIKYTLMQWPNQGVLGGYNLYNVAEKRTGTKIKVTRLLHRLFITIFLNIIYNNMHGHNKITITSINK